MGTAHGDNSISVHWKLGAATVDQSDSGWLGHLPKGVPWSWDTVSRTPPGTQDALESLGELCVRWSPLLSQVPGLQRTGATADTLMLLQTDPDRDLGTRMCCCT